VTALGRQAYAPGRTQGILFASPLLVGLDPESWRPGKLAIVFIAADRGGAFELERWFRNRFEG
jgi:hypothetical protein